MENNLNLDKSKTTAQKFEHLSASICNFFSMLGRFLSSLDHLFDDYLNAENKLKIYKK